MIPLLVFGEEWLDNTESSLHGTRNQSIHWISIVTGIHLQALLTLLAKSCIDRGTINNWSLGIRDHVLVLNTTEKPKGEEEAKPHRAKRCEKLFNSV